MFKRDAFAETRFVWDGNRLLAETRGSSTRTWVYEGSSFVPLAQLDSWSKPKANVLHFHTDHLGTPRELTDGDGNLQWTATYKAWGNVLRVEIMQSVVASETATLEQVQALRFQGQYFDAEIGLHYNRFRYYDPDCGRFVSQDPIGLSGGDNLYQYAANPGGWIDPLGLSGVQYVDPKALNFSQSWVSPNDYATVINQKGWIGDPLTVISRDGQLVSFDNRRLAAAQALGMEKVPINIVDGSSPYPPSPNGKTWDQAFDKRLKENGLGQYGTSETPAIGKEAGKTRVQENRRNNVGCK